MCVCVIFIPSYREKAQTPERDIFPSVVSCAHRGEKWGKAIISEIESTLVRFSCQTLVTPWLLHPPAFGPRPVVSVIPVHDVFSRVARSPCCSCTM